MNDYGFSLSGADTTRKGGATNNGGKTAVGDAANVGGSGGLQSVYGAASPVTAKGGVTNNGTDNVPHVDKG